MPDEADAVRDPELAVYRTTPSTGALPARPVEIEQGVQADDQAVAFIASRGLTEYVPCIVGAIRSCFSQVRSIGAHVVRDPEIPEATKLVFELEVGGRPGEVFEAERAYVRSLIETVPREERELLTLLISME